MDGRVYKVHIVELCPCGNEMHYSVYTDGVAFDHSAIGEHIFLSTEDAEKHYKDMAVHEWRL